MQNAVEIYGKQVRQMPSSERLRLATLILEDLTAEQTENGEQPKPFRVQARSLGLRPDLNLDKTAELLEIVEGADYK